MNGTRKNLSLFDIKASVLLTILICLIYSNTLNCGWHLDDNPNITQNPKVQMSSLDIDSIKNCFYATPGSNNIDRPFAYFTFALNWLWGKDNVTGYHLVNIGIHILTAIILFMTISLLFYTPNLKGWDQNSIYFVAFLSSVLWAIHPIQTQAVTYIVQRMASLAALFYVIGIFCYLKARLSQSFPDRTLFYILCFIAFLLGVGSKNNAILLPIILFLTEVIFFRDLAQKSTRRIAVAIFFSGTLIVILAGVFLFMDGKIGGIFNGYDTRTFTLYERLLTQPGIVLFYLSQIFYPTADRFSIAHDFTISTSLFDPWTTLPSILIILLLIGVALWRIKKNPVLSFAILFFFANHVIESTIIPLEMVFEHRNYLPMLFLFVPISIGVKKTLDYYASTSKPMFYFLIISIVTILGGLGTSTYIRNMDWLSAKTLWGDAMIKAPNSARPLQNLASKYYFQTGQINKAVNLYHKAVDLSDNNVISNFHSYYNLAYIYNSQLNDFEKSVEYAKKAKKISSNSTQANLLLCNSLCKVGRFDEAITYLDQLIDKNPNHTDYLYLKGFILLKTSKPEEALNYFRLCLQIYPNNFKYLREIGLSFTHLKQYDKGLWFLKLAESFNPRESGILLALADNRIKAGHPVEAYEWTERLIENIGADNIESVVIQLSKDPLGLPIAYDEIVMVISQKLMEHSKKYSDMGVRLIEHFSSSK
jgi:protein O-mannosyl-transferase